jgi:serine/threonine-protein kinase
MGSYILDNRYCLLHSIKQNDYGQTFLAADLALERQKCIIKKLLANARDVPMAKIRELLFDREARILQKLKGKHDQIPKFYRYFNEPGAFYLVKATLSSNLGEVIDRAIALEPSNRYTSAREMLSALQSPSTIYLMTSDTNDEPKSLKPRSKLTFAAKPWLLWLIFAGELAALWFGLTYLILTPDYRSSISNVWEFSLGESPIVMPNDESTDLVLDNRPNFPLFATGTLATTILEQLGQPIARQPGYWSNSIAWSYKNISASGIDLGYLFDLQTQKLRQTEVAVPPETNLATLQYTLQELIPQGKSLSIDTGLQSVYNRQIDRYSFTVGSLEGIVERNSEDRIYIGIWEADFH